MATDLRSKYDDFYRQRTPEYVYPVEFVVRAYLGSYPRLSREPSYAGGRVVDIGFGDGRNIPLLSHLGMAVYGVEISEDICRAARERLQRVGVSVDARVGRNSAIPFEDRFFDHALSCHSCYYVDAGTRFDDNAAEIARILAPWGRWVFSAPMTSSYILQGAVDQGDGHFEIRNDPYGVRNGVVMRAFESPLAIESALDAWFTDFRIGSCRNDFWGIEEHVWTVVCRRQQT
jgi:SAM-dependent methyltransferase